MYVRSHRDVIGIKDLREKLTGSKYLFINISTPRRGTCGECHEPVTLVVAIGGPIWLHDHHQGHRIPFIYNITLI